MTRHDREQLVAVDKAHVWHPFTQMQGWLASEPLIAERAEGCWLVDTDGRRYLDGVSSLWVNVHRHTTPLGPGSPWPAPPARSPAWSGWRRSWPAMQMRSAPSSWSHWFRLRAG